MITRLITFMYVTFVFLFNLKSYAWPECSFSKSHEVVTTTTTTMMMITLRHEFLFCFHSLAYVSTCCVCRVQTLRQMYLTEKVQG